MSNNKTIKLFVSSTFLDFQKERSALQQIVFPRLKEFCLSKGFQFQPVDLRWGVTEEVVENNQSLNFCINEVKRCSSDPQPSMLILLGQRYGWIPVPTELPLATWNKLFTLLSDEERTLLEQWYTLDTNSIEPSYYLGDKRNRHDWSLVEKRLSIIFTALRIADHTFGDAYFYSATEHEIRFGLAQGNISSVVFNREFYPHDEHSDYISTSPREIQAIQGLKQYLANQKSIKLFQRSVELNEYNNIEWTSQTLLDTFFH